MEFLLLIKNFSWLIGLIGGILGIISFRFNYKNYIEKFEKEKNREIFSKHINITYQECFASNLKVETELFNTQRILDLIFTIQQNNIGFKSLSMRFRYFRLKLVCSAIIKNSKINPNFLGFGVPQNTLDKFKADNFIKINSLKKQYLTFYELIVGYRIAK